MGGVLTTIFPALFLVIFPRISLKILVHGALCFALAQPKTKASDGIAIGRTYRYTYYSSNKVLFDLSPIAVGAVIIEKATRTS